MTQSVLTDTGAAKRPKSRRADWIVLPALSLLTISAMAVSAELLSRCLFPVTQVGFQNCFVTNDPTGEAPVKPNSVCWERTAESSLKTEYRFNSRGHRAGTELNAKPPESYRIVLIGSSFTQGLFVPREKIFAALLLNDLSAQTGRNVEVYNEGTGGKFRGGSYPTQNSAQNFDQVLAAQPDLILWVITPGDISNSGAMENTNSIGAAPIHEDSPSGTSLPQPRSSWKKLAASIANGTFLARLKSRWEDSRTSVVLKHFLIASESEDEYVESYLKNGDDANFLMVQPSPKWQVKLQSFDAELAAITSLAKNANVPLVAVFVPNRPQAAMLSRNHWQPDYDPFKVENQIRDSLVDHGGRFIDILGDYRGIPGLEKEYFPVDGHLNADGHAMVARFLAKNLSGGALPTLSAPSQAQKGIAGGN